MGSPGIMHFRSRLLIEPGTRPDEAHGLARALLILVCEWGWVKLRVVFGLLESQTWSRNPGTPNSPAP